MIPTRRAPTHPGEILLEEFLKPLEMTQTQLATKMGMHVQQLNPIINGHRSVTARTALLLARTFDTTPEFWMNLQTTYDLWQARQDESRHAAG